jgi:hypothetical protein
LDFIQFWGEVFKESQEYHFYDAYVALLRQGTCLICYSFSSLNTFFVFNQFFTNFEFKHFFVIVLTKCLCTGISFPPKRQEKYTPPPQRKPSSTTVHIQFYK